MGEFSLTHLLLLAVIFLIFFGPSRLPSLGKSVGQAIRGFKQGLSEIDVEAKDIHDDHKQVTQNPAQKANTQNQAQNQKDTAQS